MFGASGEDNQVSLWDLGVEAAEPLIIEDTEVRIPVLVLLTFRGNCVMNGAGIFLSRTFSSRPLP